MNQDMRKMKPKLIEIAKDVLRTGVVNVKGFFALLQYKSLSCPQILRKILSTYKSFVH